METTKITVGGKLYGYYKDANGNVTDIRSETNPYKTPYLKKGSAQYNKVEAAIKAAL